MMTAAMPVGASSAALSWDGLAGAFEQKLTVSPSVSSS
jgi:hypothetical protein